MRRRAGEGTVIRRKDGRYEARITIGRSPDGRQVYKSFYGKTEDDVAAKLAEAQQRRAGGIVLAGKRHTVAKYLRAWLVAAEPRLRQSTHRRYRQIIENNLIPILGSVALAELTPKNVETMYAEAKHLSPRTRHHMRAVLRNALEDALRDGHVMRNVARLARLPGVSRSRRPFLGAEDVKRLVIGARDDELHALWLLAVGTGMRQGELLGLRWSDIDLEAGRLAVEHSLQRDSAGRLVLAPTKTEQSRRGIAIGAATVTVLRGHKARQNEMRLRAGGDVWGDGGYVFTRADGRPLDGTAVHHRWVSLSKRLGLPRITFHDLRHTAASHMLAGGIDLKLVSEQLGHSTIRLTADTYAHVLPDQMRQIADAMDVLIAGDQA